MEDAHQAEDLLKDAESDEAEQVAQRADEDEATNETRNVPNGPSERNRRVADWLYSLEPDAWIVEEWSCLYKGCESKPYQNHCTRNRRRHMDIAHLGLHRIACPVSGCKRTPYTAQALKQHMKMHTKEQHDACGWLKTYSIPKDPVYDGWVQDLKAHPEQYNAPEPDDPIRAWLRDHEYIQPDDELWDKFCRLPGDNKPVSVSHAWLMEES